MTQPTVISVEIFIPSNCANLNGFIYDYVGYVNFVDRGTAFNEGLAQFWGNQVYMGVDYKSNVGDSERGRKAIRITSNKAYNGNNIIVIDAQHMPSSAGTLANGCSLWPAFW
jgi:hypothetical protein